MHLASFSVVSISLVWGKWASGFLILSNILGRGEFPFQVEKLLENYMQEVGISEQQFLDACSSPHAKSKTLQVSKGYTVYKRVSKDIGIIYIRVCVCVCDKVLTWGNSAGF